MLSSLRASTARTSLRFFIVSSSRPAACFRLSCPSPQLEANIRIPYVRTLGTKGTQLENLADLINETASKSEYSPRTEDVQQAHSVFIGNLPSFLDEAGIKAHLKGFPGIDDARFNIVRDYSGASLGYGFVDFRSPAHADEMVRLMSQNWIIEGRKINVQLSIGKNRAVSHRSASPTSTIMLKALPPSTDLETLREVFAAFEGVKNIRLVDPGDKSRGCLGFAYFRTAEDAESAMKVLADSDLTIDHRPVRAFYAQERTRSEDRPISRTLQITGLGDSKDRLYRILRDRKCEKFVTRINFGKEGVLVQFNNTAKAKLAHAALRDAKQHDGTPLSLAYVRTTIGGPPLLRVPGSLTFAPSRRGTSP